MSLALVVLFVIVLVPSLAHDLLDIKGEVFTDYASELENVGVSAQCLKTWRDIPTSTAVVEELGGWGTPDLWWKPLWDDEADKMLDSFTRRAVAMYLLLPKIRYWHPSCNELSMGHLSYACECAEILMEAVGRNSENFSRLFLSQEARDEFNERVCLQQRRNDYALFDFAQKTPARQSKRI